MPLNINLQQILLHALNFVILFGATAIRRVVFPPTKACEELYGQPQGAL